MSKHFCCCIPVRFGVLVVSLLAFLSSGVLAAAIWWTIAHQNDPDTVDLTGGLKPAFIAMGVHSSIVAIMSILGFIGAIFRKRALVAFYAAFLWGSLIINTGVGIYYVVQVFRNFDQGVQNCKDRVKEGIDGDGHKNNVISACISAPVGKAVFVTIFAIELLVMLYGTIIVHRYKHQLDEERQWEGQGKQLSSAPTPEQHPLSAPRVSYNEPANLMSYHPVSSYPDNESYLYSTPQHSYGHQHA